MLLEPFPRDTPPLPPNGGVDSAGGGGGGGGIGDNGREYAACSTPPPPAASFEMIVAALEGDGSSLLLEASNTPDEGGLGRAAVRTDALLRGASMVVGMHSDGEIPHPTAHSTLTAHCFNPSPHTPLACDPQPQRRRSLSQTLPYGWVYPSPWCRAAVSYPTFLASALLAYFLNL